MEEDKLDWDSLYMGKPLSEAKEGEMDFAKFIDNPLFKNKVNYVKTPISSTKLKKRMKSRKKRKRYYEKIQSR